MTPYYRIEALTHYPEWHKQPLRLTIPEIENPFIVIHSFFDAYSLANIRQAIEQLFEDAIEGEDAPVKSHLFNIQNLHRLVEAAWLLFKQTGKREDLEEDALEVNEQVNEKGNTQHFVKQPRSMDLVISNPMQALHAAIHPIGVKALKLVIVSWLNTALTTNEEPYDTATERAGAMAFCIRLKYLVEAAWISSRRNKIQEQKGIDVNNYYQLSTTLFKKEGIEDLSEEEIQQPYTIVKDFFSRFSLLHSRAELWDLFSTVIKCNNEHTNKAETLINYQRLCTLIEALYILQKQNLPGPITG